MRIRRPASDYAGVRALRATRDRLEQLRVRHELASLDQTIRFLLLEYEKSQAEKKRSA